MKAIRLVWHSEVVEPGVVNPLVVVQRQSYRMGAAMIDQVYFNASSRYNPQYKASPFYHIELHGELVCDIEAGAETYRFPVFQDLAAIGCTAYFGLRLHPYADYRQTISFATDSVDGFGEERVTDLRWGLSLFTLLLDTLLEAEVKRTMASAYLGAEPGRLVVNGMIGPGEVQSMDAAIWFSDLRGYTAMSSDMPPDRLVAELNEYFEVVVAAIYEHGGEVLKYIGDAVLAVFPVNNFNGSIYACRAALRAACDACDELKELNFRRGEKGLEALQHGVGLHIGSVKFGNIGTLQRLDFTVVGTEVNLTARVEALCGQLGEQILCSETLGRMVDTPVRLVGEYELKGIKGPVSVFAPLTD
jgi:adenylate cyclase